MADATSIAAVWRSVSSQLPAKYSDAITLTNGSTTTFTHGFNLPITKLKVVVFEDGEELSSLLKDTYYLITQNTLNIINIQNISGGSRTFNVLVIGYKLIESSGGSSPIFTAKSSNFNATAGDNYIIDTTGGVITGTLPSSPSIGDTIQFHDARNYFGTNAFTLGRNTKNINGSANDFDCNIQGMKWSATYLDATYGWSITF